MLTKTKIEYKTHRDHKARQQRASTASIFNKRRGGRLQKNNKYGVLFEGLLRDYYEGLLEDYFEEKTHQPTPL